MAEQTFKKKVDTDGYGNDISRYDFMAEAELMVTITLSEYRALIKEVSLKKHDLEEASNEKYEKRHENEKLKEQIEVLKTQLQDANREIAYLTSAPKTVAGVIDGLEGVYANSGTGKNIDTKYEED